LPEVKNKPPEDVIVDVAENLNPDPFGRVVRKARNHVDEPGVGGVKIACDLHRLVRTKVDYAEYANFRHPPRESLGNEGNCVDTTCLFCSLLIRAGFECRIVSVTLRDRGHMFTEVLLRGSHAELHDDIVD
jgi:transglutaminase-like putative cysteine protease